MNYVSFDTGLCYDFGYTDKVTYTTSPFGIVCIYSSYYREFAVRTYGVHQTSYSQNCTGPNGYPRACNDYLIRVTPINYKLKNYNVLYCLYYIDYEYYSYKTHLALTNPGRFKIKNNDVLKEMNIELTLSTPHPRISDALPHPHTYGYVPITARFVDDYIYPDAIQFFNDNFKLLLKDQITGTVKSLWYNSSQEEFEIDNENEPFYTIVHDYVITTDENNTVYKIEIKNNKISVTDITKEIGIMKKVIPQYNIVPDTTNKTGYSIITGYRIYYNETDGLYVRLMTPATEPTDIRSYHLIDGNYEDLDSTQLVHQITKFDEFYKNYISKIFINFKKKFTHGQYPLFEVYDRLAILKNIKVSDDTLNLRDPEQIYLYVVTSDFKILSKIKIIDGIDVKIEKVDSIDTTDTDITFRITVGDLGLFDVKYIDGSNYADVVVSERLHKDTKIYFFFAPDNMVSTQYDYLYNYRFISFEYYDTRKFDIKNANNTTTINQPIVELRNPINIKGIKSLNQTITQIYQNFRATLYPRVNKNDPPVIETTDYQHLCCGFKTKCGNYYTYFIFVEGADSDFIKIKTYEEEFDDYILAQIKDNLDISKKLKSYVINFDFIRSIICKYQFTCEEVQLMCWNRMLDVPAAESANLFKTETFNDEYQGTLTMQYIVDAEVTMQYITREKFYSEYTLGEHNNFVLNHQNLSKVFIESRDYLQSEDVYVYIDNIVIEPDVLMIDRDTYEEYRPFSLGLRCFNDSDIQDERWAVVPAYTLADGTLHPIYRPQDFKTGCYRHPYVLKFEVPLRVKLWEEYNELQQFENLNASSNQDIVLQYKYKEEKDILNIEDINKNFKLVDYVGIGMKFYKNMYDIRLKDESSQLQYQYDLNDTQGFFTFEIYPNKKIDGKSRWYVSNRFIPNPDDFQILGYIGLKYILIEYENFIYMPSRNEILVEDTDTFISIINVSVDPDYLNPIRYDYLTNITYVNFTHLKTTSFLITSHINEITTRITYDKINPSKYLYDLKHYAPVATYRNNFINTTIAKG